LIFLLPNRIDTENKQLLTVINQLRSSRKDKTSETETLQQELVSLRQQAQSLTNDNSECKLFKEQYHHFLIENQSLLNDFNLLQDQLKKLQQEYNSREAFLVQQSTEIMTKQQLLYEKDKIIENHKFEEKFQKKSVENSLMEISNLKEIINNYENSFQNETKEWKRKYHELLKEKELFQKEMEAKYQNDVNSLKTELGKEKQALTNTIQEKDLSMKHLQQQINKEKQLLQKNMENVIFQMQNTNSNVVDKQLIGNLIVSYFQRKRYSMNSMYFHF
jgi:uncharacterized protein (DUF3084 family)